MEKFYIGFILTIWLFYLLGVASCRVHDDKELGVDIIMAPILVTVVTLIAFFFG